MQNMSELAIFCSWKANQLLRCQDRPTGPPLVLKCNVCHTRYTYVESKVEHVQLRKLMLI